jgi:hypothetical protein
MQEPGHAGPVPTKLLIGILVLAAVVPSAYSAYTGQVWEDSLITLRHSENLLKGEGLVFNPGERVHGFTSPINVVLLALCRMLTGQTSYVATFWAYRVLCVAGFAAGGVLSAPCGEFTQMRWKEAARDRGHKPI